MAVADLEEGEICDEVIIKPSTNAASAEAESGFSDQSIDERLDRVLGHYRKAFEGLISGETLGAMYGGYGTFLIDPNHSSSSGTTSGGNPTGGIQKTRKFGTQLPTPECSSRAYRRFAPVQKCSDVSGKGLGPEKYSSLMISSLNRIKESCNSVKPRKDNYKDPTGVTDIRPKQECYMDKENIPSNVNSQVPKTADDLGARRGVLGSLRPSEPMRKTAKSDSNKSGLDGRNSVGSSFPQSSGIIGGKRDKNHTNHGDELITRDTSSRKRNLKDYSGSLNNRLEEEKRSNSITVSGLTSKRQTTSSDATGQIKASAAHSTILRISVSGKVSISRVPEQTCRHDVPAPLPASTSPVPTLLKDAEVLKKCANNLKDRGSRLESTGLFLEAAMKFLQGASLIEQQSNRDDKLKAMEVYRSAATLSQYCAHEFESCKKMASAALAYKCVEVSFMRMIYAAHLLNRGVHPVIPPFKSPSSPVSCVDNNPSKVDMVDFPKYQKLVEFAQDVNLGMKASMNSREAFAAAAVDKLLSGDMVASIKSALDFSFHDVDELILRVHRAMAILGS